MNDHACDNGTCARCNTVGESDARVAWMRSVGAVQAKWTVEGILTECVLGPPPETIMAPATERPASAEEQKPNENEELLFRAS